MDAIASLALVAIVLAAFVAHAASHKRTADAARFSRSTSIWFPARAQVPLYSVLDPFVRVLVRARVSPSAITVLALVPIAAGSTAFALGSFGVGALLVAFGFSCDALDGLVARAAKTSSLSGAVLDSVCDRIGEAFVFAGLAIFFRTAMWTECAAVLAGASAQLVSYVSAKVDEHDLAARIPRGQMRRAERAVYVVAGAAVSSLLAHFVSSPIARAPMLAALGLVGIVGAASSVIRIRALVREIDAMR